MPIFVERFVLTVLAALVVTVMTVNPLRWELIQQVGAIIVLVGLAVFCAGSVHRMNPASPPPAADSRGRSSGPASSTGDRSPANTGDGNTFNYDTPAAPKQSPKHIK